jgi:enterochelin esterase-like enzyme
LKLIPILLMCAVSAVASESWNNPPKAQPAGTEHKTFHSKSMDVDVGYNIYLPPDYAANPDKRYPVIYYLHGRGGTESSTLFAFAMLDKAIKDGQVPPMIYVHAMGGRNSGYVDSVDGKIMADTAIIKELIPHIDATYRTIAEKKGRAIEGFSKGGQGALLFAFKYPEMFASVIGYGAGLANGTELKKELPAVFKEMHNDDIAQFDSTSAWAYARKNADAIQKTLPIRIALGDKDQHLTRNRNMHKLLDELKIAHEYEELEGVGHDTKKVYDLVGLKGFQFHAKNFAAK